MKFILGTKLGMSQIFGEDGNVIPVTVIEVEPNTVVQVKTQEKDKYGAVKLEIGTKRKVLKEFRTDEPARRGIGAIADKSELKVGDKLDASLFTVGDLVKVSGTSKGKGFAGVMKRHNFHGMPFTHGHHHVARHAGSIGQRFPQHTLKGMRMAGRMGAQKATTRGLKVISVDAENGLIAVKGATPGNKNSLVMIQSQQ